MTSICAPCYSTLSDDTWNEKIQTGLSMLESCNLCPNLCSINRVTGQKGKCRSGFFPKIVSAFAHTGEEPPVSGTNGSGTIFFSGCTMQCIYCQNYPFSQLELGLEVPFSYLTARMLKLQEYGCHNINLVTPTQFIPQIIIALYEAKKLGLRIPVVYNTSGFETAQGLGLLNGIVDVYLTDLRYACDTSGQRYSGVRQYATYARAALKQMAQQVGELQTDDAGLATRGLIIRLLLLPGLGDELLATIRFIADTLDFIPHISLMNQYFPTWKALNEPEMNRLADTADFEKAFNLMRRYGLTYGWLQDQPPQNSPAVVTKS